MRLQADRMPMVTGGRELEAEMITPGLPVTPGERTRGPPLRRPANRCLNRQVSTPLEHLTMFPPASKPESTLPQHGGGARASPKDPLKNASNYRNAGWRKDLEHVLKVYYRHNITSFKEVEWSKMKEKFFTHLLQHKEEWRDIKENCPIQYMPYMEDHFYMAMGIRLNGLRDFTRWIKQGSYYHGLVARQGHLHKCPHLVGVVLPRWPQTTPSESRQVSQKKAETLATSSSAPSTGAGEAQETSFNDAPAPMETGGVGDGQSWAEQVKASADDEFQRDRPTKHCRSQWRRWED